MRGTHLQDGRLQARNWPVQDAARKPALEIAIGVGLRKGAMMVYSRRRFRRSSIITSGWSKLPCLFSAVRCLLLFSAIAHSLHSIYLVPTIQPPYYNSFLDNSGAFRNLGLAILGSIYSPLAWLLNLLLESIKNSLESQWLLLQKTH